MKKIFFLMFVAFSAAAQISLQECVRIALERNATLRLAQTAVELAREDQRQAGAAMLPSIDFSGSFRRQSAVPELRIDPIELPFGGGTFSPFGSGRMQLGTPDVYDFKLTLTQPLYSGRRLYNAKRAAIAMAGSKEGDWERSRQEIIFKVEAAYASVLKAQQFSAIAANVVAQIDAHLKDVQALLAQGLARSDEWLKVQVKRSEADLALLRAQNGVRLARAMLENVQGQSLADSVVLLAMRPDSMPLPERESSLRLAFANRPEVKMLQYAADAAEAGKKIARGAWLPSLVAFGSLGYGKPGLDFIDQEWMDYWLVGIGAEWHLWDGGRTISQVQQAELRRRSIAENQRQTYDAITLEVTQACLQLQEAQQRVAVASLMEKQAGESYRITERQYQQGQASHSDFFDAQSEWTRAQLQKVEAEIDLALAQANWRRAVGLSAKYYNLP